LWGACALCSSTCMCFALCPRSPAPKTAMVCWGGGRAAALAVKAWSRGCARMQTRIAGVRQCAPQARDAHSFPFYPTPAIAQQLVQFIALFLPNLCESMSLEHKGMWAEQSSFRASGRWSWHLEWCTCGQASGPRWRPLPRPAHLIWRQFRPAWCFGGK